jgi:myo-inositol-1(or 4)-monophosphatase
MSRTSESELRFAVDTAVAAGKVLLRHFGRLSAGAISSKARQRHNLVTRADTEAERLVVDRISRRFPSHAILTEETGQHGRASAGGERWIVDPLDGTINFVHEIVFFAVSIALERGGEIVAGVVHAPLLGETFSAARGRGAFLGRRRLRVSRTGDLRDALFATGFPYDRTQAKWDNRENFSRLVHAGRGIRRLGSAALDVAYVAAGRIDAFWELRLRPWDVAAASLLVTEAGGRVTDLRGGDDWLFGGHVVATNGRLHEATRRRLSLPGRGGSTRGAGARRMRGRGRRRAADAPAS